MTNSPQPAAVIGIDGGGSRSEGVLMLVSGQVLAHCPGGPLNYHTTSFEIFRRNLRSLVHDLVQALPPQGELQYSVVGTAAIFHTATPEETQQALEGLLPLPSAALVGDAPVALYGATRGQPGVLVIAGTGSIAVALDPDGQFHTTGGFGPLLGGDPGSAFWMAAEAVQQAVRRRAELGILCPLGEQIVRYFGLAHLEEIVPHIYGVPEGWRLLAGLSGFLAQTSLPDEAGFLDIQGRAGRELALLVAPLLTRLSQHPRQKGAVRLFLSGSVLQLNQVVRDSMQKSLQEKFQTNICLGTPECDPAQGAALLALKLGAPQKAR